MTISQRIPRGSDSLKRIAVLVESSRSFGRGVLHGIADEMRTRRKWLVYYQEGGLSEILPEWFENWEGDGIIARIENRTIADAILQKNIPAVDIRGVLSTPNIPTVKTDNREIARLAAEHLAACGFHRFAFCGYDGASYSNERCTAFVEYVEAAGRKCHVFRPQEPETNTVREQEQRGWEQEELLVNWLRTLPVPIGIMCCNDARGHQLLNAAHRLDLNLPDDVAVIGVDNYETICNISVPQLTSVEQNTAQIAAEAVRLLSLQLEGEPPPTDTVLVKPCRVVARRSTDALAVNDPNLREAVRYIREHVSDEFGVEDVARAVGMSRRELERGFVSAFGHAPGREIIAARLRTVKSLLVDTDLTLYQIAEAAGFRHAEYLNVAFKRQTGMTPGRYREQMRAPASTH